MARKTIGLLWGKKRNDNYTEKSNHIKASKTVSKEFRYSPNTTSHSGSSAALRCNNVGLQFTLKG